jgi:hypothetical protein
MLRSRLSVFASRLVRRGFSSQATAIAIMQENFAVQLRAEYPQNRPYAVSDATLWGIQNRALAAHKQALFGWLKEQEPRTEEQDPLRHLAEMEALREAPERLFREVILPVTERERPHLLNYQAPKEINFRNIRRILEPFRYGMHQLKEQSSCDERQAANYHYAIRQLLDFYIFLCRNELNITPLQRLLDALETDKALYQWLQRHLRANPFQKPSELWRAGFHEHFPCSTIRPILEQAAGMSETNESLCITERTDRLAAIDLLLLFYQLRSRSSSLFFWQTEEGEPYTIKGAHPPGLKTALPIDEQAGNDLSQGSFEYHQELKKSVEQGGALLHLVSRAEEITNQHVLQGHESLDTRKEAAYTIYGDDLSTNEGLARAQETMAKEAKKRSLAFRFFCHALKGSASTACVSRKGVSESSEPQASP